MKKFYLFLFLGVTTVCFSQQEAWVYFNAKPNSQMYFEAPSKMLSERALYRRTTQNIPLDIKDIPIESSYNSQLKATPGITVMAKSKWLNAIHVRGSQAAINTLKILSFVEKIDFADKSLNQSGKTAPSIKIKQTSTIKKTNVTYPYGSSSNQIIMLNGQALHQQNYTGSGKIIAVMDAGFPGVNTAQPFQKLRDNAQILGGYNFVSRNSDFYTGSSHGTSVLSTMGGYKENALVGTAPDASYYLFITEDNNSENPLEESLWVEAAEKADSLGVDIINTSLGYFDFDNPAYNYTYNDLNGETAFMSKGAEIAYSRGMILVVSAGNSGGTSSPYISVPADARSVLSVGSVDANKIIASSSSIGPTFDQRIKPEVMAQGKAAIVSNAAGNIVTADGTSFSGPILAGMIACLWQAFPEKTNQQIKELIIKSSDKFLTPNNNYGYGIPNFGLALNNTLLVPSFYENELVLYPNPATEYISVVLPLPLDNARLSIYSLLGQKKIEQKMSSQSTIVSLKSLERGTYFYRIEANGFFNTGKIIKQ